ncbi:MAG: flagellar hook-length control protein FliK [Solirubrobacterales bacterium]
MTSSTAVYDIGISGVRGNTRSTAALDESATPEQRFADMLPIAEAAQERQPEEVASEDDHVGEDLDEEPQSEDVLETSDDSPEESEEDPNKESDRAATANAELIAWCLADVGQPLPTPVVQDSASVAPEAMSSDTTGVLIADQPVKTTLPSVSDVDTTTNVEGPTVDDLQALSGAVPAETDGGEMSPADVTPRPAEIPEVADSAADVPASNEGANPSAQAQSPIRETISRSVSRDGQDVPADPQDQASPEIVASSDLSDEAADVQEESPEVEMPEMSVASSVDDRATSTKDESESTSASVASAGEESATTDLPVESEWEFDDGEWGSEQDAATEEMEVLDSVDTNVNVKSHGDGLYATVAEGQSPTVSESLASSTGESVTQSVSTETTSASAAGNVDHSVVRSVGEQILDSMRASIGQGEKQILVRLTPPEMGTVVVRLQERGDQVSGLLEVSTTEARREIERALPQVIQSLQDSGIQVRRIEVQASDQPRQDLNGDSSSQDGWLQQRSAEQGREQSSMASPMRWWQNASDQVGGSYGNATGQSEIAGSTEGRIDLLM